MRDIRGKVNVASNAIIHGAMAAPGKRGQRDAARCSQNPELKFWPFADKQRDQHAEDQGNESHDPGRAKRGACHNHFEDMALQFGVGCGTGHALGHDGDIGQRQDDAQGRDRRAKRQKARTRWRRHFLTAQCVQAKQRQTKQCSQVEIECETHCNSCPVHRRITSR
ncbi:hypothetical protein FQZ97_947650 [compost metagenome]